MRGSMFKYIDQRQDASGNALFWPGSADGFPFRGERPAALRDDEFENLKLVGDFKHRTFYFDDPNDTEEYAQIMDRVSNGWYYKLDRDRQWDETRKCYRVYLEWLEIYAITPQGGKSPLYQVGANDAESVLLPLRQAEEG